MKEVKSFVIDRGEWLPKEAHGPDGTSKLFAPESGRMCCLGVYLRACGLSKESLSGKMMPGNHLGEPIPEWLIHDKWSGPSLDAYELANINDAIQLFEGVSLAEREKLIVSKFAKQGIKVRFKGRLFPRGKTK
jgi:hypothetical protein